MNPRVMIESLAAGPARLRGMTAGLEPASWRWRPAPQSWSILEVLGHLVDEERRDFRVRLELVLGDPQATWPAIDPEAWVHVHAYQEQDPAAQLDAFEAERAHSLEWLRSLEVADWTVSHDHPRAGPLSAADLLCSWAAHDLLHLRQIARLLFEANRAAGAPGRPDYAGKW